MPEYLAPGVYIEEIEIGAKPIEGVSTSTAGFIGETERGPITPSLITGMEQFYRVYGGYLPNSFLTYAVKGFFSNGGKRCFISRIIGKNSKCATLEILASQGEAIKETKLGKEPGKEISEKESAKESSEKLPPKVTETEEKFSKGTSGSIKSKAIEVKAISPGVWGNRVALKIEEASLSALNPTLFKMTVIYWKEAPPSPVVDPTILAKQKDLNRREPSLVEVYDNLSQVPASTDFYEKRINNISSLVEVHKIGDAASFPGKELKFFQGGSDGASVTLTDYKGDSIANPGERLGFEALSEVDEISIVCAPNENDYEGLTDALVEHCELMKDRFAILQTKQNAGPISNLMRPTDSKYGALYYPWLKVIDPLTNNQKIIPPGGHVAGIYARSDAERGIHKAPANEVVRGVVGIQFPLTKGDQDILNPRGVNCIRTFPGRGIRVWGARTISSDPLWKYINVRRLFLYLEESIEEGTQWVVFEPNDRRLWARVKQTVTDFLTRVWKDGALLGATPEEAFFVKCDETTMTPDDLENGRLIILIGVAPVKPAEFVIFRIAQWRSGSEVSE